MWPVSVVYVTITSLKEVMQLIVKHPLEFFPPHTKMGRQLWTQHCDKFKTDNTSNLPHILHAFFCEVCDIDHPWLLKETPISKTCRQWTKTFIPSLLSAYNLCTEFFLVAVFVHFFLSTALLYSWPLQTSSGEDAEDFCWLVHWNSYNKLPEHNDNNRNISGPHGR